MPTDNANIVTPYFDTPERAERLQLVVHLLRNADEIPYLRAPEGAGKTRFAQHLLEDNSEEFSIIWLNAFAGKPIESSLYDQMGLDEGKTVWPNDVLSSSPERTLLLIIDDADALDLASLGKLFELHDLGARLLFIGNGGLAHLQGEWDLQFVDLPAFSEAQTLEFIEQSGHTSSGQINESVAAGLHRASNGLPGFLVEALTAMSLKKVTQSKENTSSRFSPLLISAIVACLLLIGLGWYFQDQINAVFEKPVVVKEPHIYTFDDADEKIVGSTPAPVDESKFDDGQEIKAIERDLVDPVVVDEKAPVVEQVEEALNNTQPVIELAEIKAEPAPAEQPVIEAEAKEEEPDPVFDAVVDAVIAAAAQEPIKEEINDEKKLVEVESTKLATVDKKAETALEEKPVATIKPAEKQVMVEKKIVSAKKKSDAPLDPDSTWLMAQQPNRYTLQLVGAREKAAIRQFVATHKVTKPYAIFERDLNGKPWFSLVAGVYSDRDAAVAARSKLKAPLNGGGVWPRTFASIQEGLVSQ